MEEEEEEQQEQEQEQEDQDQDQGIGGRDPAQELREPAEGESVRVGRQKGSGRPLAGQQRRPAPR